ncbi:hypothetical protein KSF_035990 [Reticulibacter mediterranei]|uniref:Uncharacterized protein n=1 Tax=Reticulibacter mediterranei TaxID=2778369 RepID=A0A8J3IFI5_9CHLR|nr:hypothetical protein [Reticulibacter mediterranei]GHO93551.1 hypothetical protein KSF_035990 [Reticulibacter mediterranei]
MPEYAQIQTYATYTARNLQTLLQLYRTVLEQLGCTDAQVIAWLSQVEWPASEEEGFGDIYASPFSLHPVDDADPIECAGLSISFYTQSGAPSLEDPPLWIAFNLLFDVAKIRRHAAPVYRSGVGGAIWYIMRELAESFREVGIYFTDEWQENQSWRAIAENVGDPWIFDLAIFPRELADRFKEVPPGFQGTVIEGGFGFAQENRWPALPWDEAGS